MAFSHRHQRNLALLLSAASIACAPAGRVGDVIEIAEESAIILWDATSKTQHFIRRASFETKANDFGFLVPTPTVPELKEASDEAFDFLDLLTDPPERREVAKSAAPKAAAKAAAAPKVEVIAKVKLAGYDAAVLKANDAGALDGWLKQNGYHSSPELVEWVQPYIEKSWIVTAFKVTADGAGSGRAEASAIRMSFQAERPYFPYREPATRSASGGARLLNLYFIGDMRPEGRIGGSAAWPGRTSWSTPFSGGDRDRLQELLKLPPSVLTTSHSRLTRFVDLSSPRPGRDDLYFTPAIDQSEVRAPHLNPNRKQYGHEYRSSHDLMRLAVLAGAVVAAFWASACAVLIVAALVWGGKRLCAR